MKKQDYNFKPFDKKNYEYKLRNIFDTIGSFPESVSEAGSSSRLLLYMGRIMKFADRTHKFTLLNTIIVSK